MRSARLQEMGKWIKYNFLAGRGLLTSARVANGIPVSEEALQEVESFFQLCRRGRNASMEELVKTPRLLEGSNMYHEIFVPASHSEDIQRYDSASQMLRQGDKTSAAFLRAFFNTMIKYTSSRFRQALENKRPACLGYI